MIRASVTLEKRERERERERERSKKWISPCLPVGLEGRVATSIRDTKRNWLSLSLLSLSLSLRRERS